MNGLLLLLLTFCVTDAIESLHAAGNRLTTTYSTGRSEVRTYDALNRIATLVEGGRTTQWNYDKAGRAIALSLGNGQQQDNHYDAAGRLKQRHLYNANESLLASFTWTHDAVGNVTGQTEQWLGDPGRNAALRSTVMGYDDVNRLLSETVTQANEVTRATLYTYDGASNRASKEEKEGGVTVKVTAYTYNDANQLTGWSEEDGEEEVLRSAVLSYDTRGNRVSHAITTHGTTPATETTTYTWTAQNLLAGVTLPDSSVHGYAYDYRARRITRSEGSAAPVAVSYNGGVSAAEFEVTDPGTGALAALPTVEYQRGPDMGGGVGGMLYSVRGSVVKYSLSNGRGDVVAQSDSTGVLSWSASYEAYGKRPVESGSNADRQRANTKEEDPTGLLNEGWRYRDLETGVWLSRDPAGFVDGPNLYAYVRQNPWTAWDPLGLRKDNAGYEWVDRDHHIIPVDVASDYWSDPKAKAILDGARIETPGGHNFRAHGRATGYSGHVEAELQKFMKDRGVDSIAGQSARKQEALAKAFVHEIENSSNKFIRGFNTAVSKGKDVLEGWFIKSGQHLPMPGKLGKLELKASGYFGYGKKIPVVKWLVGAALAIPTYQSLRAEGMSPVDAAAGTVVDAANPVPISTSEMGGMVTEAQRRLGSWVDTTQANLIDARFPKSDSYTDPALREMVQEMQDDLKQDPSRGSQ